MDELTKALADFFLTQRKNAKLSIEEAASVLGISSKQLEIFEKGDAPMPTTLIFALANAYGSDPEAVLSLIQLFQPRENPSG